MAEAHLDHPGDVSWVVGHGPAPVIGPCPHTDCRHLGLTNIAWGPDLERYVLNVCDEPAERNGCEGQCRAWHRDRLPVVTEADTGRQRVLGRFIQVDPTREHRTTREERSRQVAR